jgi:hypothetical protein
MTDTATGSLQAGASYLHPLLPRRRAWPRTASGNGPGQAAGPGTRRRVAPRVLAADGAAPGAVCVDGRTVDLLVAERARRIIGAQQ